MNRIILAKQQESILSYATLEIIEFDDFAVDFEVFMSKITEKQPFSAWKPRFYP